MVEKKIRGVPSPLGEALYKIMKNDVESVKNWPLWLRQNIVPPRQPDPAPQPDRYGDQ